MTRPTWRDISTAPPNKNVQVGGYRIAYDNKLEWHTEVAVLKTSFFGSVWTNWSKTPGPTHWRELPFPPSTTEENP